MPASSTTRGVPTGPRRGRGRGGGVTKRRSAPIKTDKDGDVAMIAMSSSKPVPRGGRGAMPAQPRDVSGTQRAQRSSSRLAANLKHRGNDVVNELVNKEAGASILKISGVAQSKAATNTDGGVRSVVTFIERKLANRNKTKVAMIQKSVMAGDTVWISVGIEFVPEIMTLNGFEHAGHPLTITPTTEPWPKSSDADETIETLKSVAASRYDASNKHLDLSSLGQDAILTAKGFFDSDKKRAMKAFQALCQVASSAFECTKDKKDAIQFITLAGNELDNVAAVFDIATQFPDIIGLDLSNNKFDKLNKLGRWRRHFRSLETLLLQGNPLQSQDPDVVKELLQWFPKLQKLDGNQIRTAEEVKAQSPVPIPQQGCDFRDVNGVGENFLREFLVLYDSDRATLASKYYDEDSQFSISVIPKSAKDSEDFLLPWQGYLRFSRNIKHLSSKSKEASRRLFHGGAMIADLWKSLPATKHPAIEEGDKLVVDAHVVSNLVDPSGNAPGVDGLVMTVNGEVDEESEYGQKGRRAFGRHFLLGPAKHGHGILRVISDQLTLRSWQPTRDSAGAIQEPNALDVGTKQGLVLELAQRTGMNLQYAKLCLEGQSAWNFQLALAQFEELKGSLGPEAFDNQPQQPPAAP